MQYKSNKGYTGFGQLGMIFLFVGIGLVLLSVVQIVIGFQFLPSGTTVETMGDELVKALQDPKNVNLARILQALGTLFIMFLPAFFYSWRCNGKSPLWLGFSKHINIYQIVLGFLIMFAANITAIPLEDFSRKILVHLPSLDKLAHQLENSYNDQIVGLTNLKSWSEFFIAVVIMAFLPALFEEVFFRGALQQIFIKWWKMPLLAIIFTSLLFSLIHMSVYLFLSRAVLGFALGWMFYKTKNIWVNIIGHFINNFIAVCQMFWLSMHNKKVDPTSMDPDVSWWGSLIALAVLYFFFHFLNRHSEENRMKIYTKEQALMVNEPEGEPLA